MKAAAGPTGEHPDAPQDDTSRSSNVSQVSRAVAWNGIATLAATIFGMAASILTIRFLTKTQYGDFTVAANYLRYASILSLFTLDAALLRYVPEYRQRGDRKGLYNLILKVVLVHVIVWLVLTLAMVFTGSYAAGVVGISWSIFRPLLVAGILVVLPSVLYVSLQAVLTAFYQVRIQAIAVIIGGIAQLLLLWLMVERWDWGGPGAMVAQIGMSGLLLVLFAWKVWRLPMEDTAKEGKSIPLRRLLGFSVPFVINGVAAAVFLRQSEVFFLRPAWGEEITATYSYAYMLSQRFLEFVPAMLFGVGNVVATQAFLQGREQLARVMGIYWRITSIIIAAVSIGGFTVADRLAVVFYGTSKGMEAGPIASILFLTQAIILFVNPYNFVMRAEEKTWLTFWLSPPAAVISIGCSLLFIPRYGLWGAVAATSASFALVTLLQYAVFQRVFPYLRLPLTYIFRCYGAAAFMLLALPLRALVPGIPGLLVLIVADIGLWIAGARVFRLFGEDETDLFRRSSLPGADLIMKVLAR